MQGFVKHYKLDRWREGGRESISCRSCAGHSGQEQPRGALGEDQSSEFGFLLPLHCPGLSLLCAWGTGGFGTNQTHLWMGIWQLWGQTKAQALKSSKPLCCGAEVPKRGWAPFAELSQGNPKRLKGHRFRASPSPDSSCPWHSSSWPAGCSLGTHSEPSLATKIRAARSWVPLWSGDQKQGHPSSSPSPN